MSIHSVVMAILSSVVLYYCNFHARESTLCRSNITPLTVQLGHFVTIWSCFVKVYVNFFCLRRQLVNNKNYTMYLCCLVVLLGTMSVGFMIGITSPLIPDIQQENHNNTPHLDATQASTFGVRGELLLL